MSGGDIWADRFHAVALAVGFVAHAEGWLDDAERVRAVVYHLYERGEWPDPVEGESG